MGCEVIDGQKDPLGQSNLARVPPLQKNPASHTVHMPSVDVEGMVDRYFPASHDTTAQGTGGLNPPGQ